MRPSRRRSPFPPLGTWTRRSTSWRRRPSSAAGRWWDGSTRRGSRASSSPPRWRASRSLSCGDGTGACAPSSTYAATTRRRWPPRSRAGPPRCGAPTTAGPIRSRENFGFVQLEPGPTLPEFLGRLPERIRPLGLDRLRFVERRRYECDSNWKVFVDNYLDGGYHIPFLHKGLDSVLDYAEYTIENEDRFCLQESPVVDSGRDAASAAVRKGQRALYYWLYPNFMINWYEGVMDTNLVRSLAVDRTEVVFDFYFADVSETLRERNLASIDVGERIQQEDLDICESVQRGLKSRAYTAGRLSVRREAGEHLFHKLLYADLKRNVSGEEPFK